ncbi:MAG: hypothetical protein COX12_00555 [Candidatus Brennerbacteria bacterium CG23_combo_of_CG06-09_8_20_14_all_44_41]|uniref:MgtC/SapB/SrpB/YhiD N-terminal domain-containing protein n=1 Tax=Candidatus Brennerbacteria bacterium CG_4_8_14_3_um_filter_43_14 TaxID=1974521 RepID=A0A2H9N6A5_9BACT|nr:MAG: hypothetical protein AUJ43_02000 [Parcubacteria group bacterium CG1_02_44_31]PIP50583.1 MAG: hypothetical protein COX12_00555 [Candidatus Brennerbacteria bacterium CG23_combo_of_CG06-09_8_20_14_all_44_41]PIX29409.1 MAG: hypothetical protein COZ64_00065 [Candidatus Brennerbacteria bacterium CG_4_8_14_3_um_filter_43_14]PJA19080.1 MAG: hypothetical protein COX61_02200 [Candidatus Brennerbacteria bacterium CG_4_10_14_0_2_um_filter_43_14]
MDFFDVTTQHILSKIIVAAFLGMCIGLERKFSHKEAGLRTFSLIALGCALFVSLGNDFLVTTWGKSFIDPMRMVGQIIIGLGFLGAGLIIFHKNKITGLTTAATMWVTAAIGSAVGLGAYAIAILATIVTLIVLVGGWKIEKSILDLSDTDK